MATASQTDFEGALEGARSKVRECPTTRGKLKATVTRACEKIDDAPAAFVSGRATGIVGAFLSSLFGRTLLVVAVILVLVACAGCALPEVAAHAKQRADGMLGVARNDSEAMRTRVVAASALDGFATTYRIADGDELRDPDGVRYVDLVPLEVRAAVAAIVSSERSGARGPCAFESCGCPATNGPCAMPCSSCCAPGPCPCELPPPSAR